MSSEGSITLWIGKFKAGDPQAAPELFRRFYQRAVQLARHKLHSLPRQEADEEDVASAAFFSLLRGASEGVFERLDNRHDLWQILARLVNCRAVDLLRRGGRGTQGKVVGEAALPNDSPTLDQYPGRDADPALAALASDEVARLLDLLGDDTLRTVALMRMEGFTDAEAAAALGCSERTIQRKTGVIRSLWNREGAS